GREVQQQTHGLSHEATPADGRGGMAGVVETPRPDRDAEQLRHTLRGALESERLREALNEQTPVDALGHLLDERPHRLCRARATVSAARRIALRHLAYQVLRQRQRILREPALEDFATLFGHERVGV